MKIRNNLNSGITVTLADKKPFVFPASSTVTLSKTQLTKRINDLISVGYLTLINDPVVSKTATEETTSTKSKKGGDK